MTIFGIGPESFWFWILCAAGSWALVLMVRVAGAVIASLRDDLRAIRNPPEGELWEAAMEDRVRPEHRAMGPCKHTFGESECGLRYAQETTYPKCEGHEPWKDLDPVEFFPTVNNPGLTPEQIEVFKREVTERLARAAYAERDTFRAEIIKQLFRKTGDMRTVLQILDSADYPTNFVKRVLEEDGVDPKTLGPIPVSRLEGKDRVMPDAWPPKDEKKP